MMTRSIIKSILVLVSAVFLLTGCGNPPAGDLEKLKQENNKLKEYNKQIVEKFESLQYDYDNLKIHNQELQDWSSELVTLYGSSIWFFSEYDKPLPQERVREATPQTLIDKLNKLFAESGIPEAIIEKITDDTIYVSISDETKLSQNLGTSGAASYINSVVFTLTSIKSIKCVNFNFKEVGHAFPGKYCRNTPAE